MSLFGAAKKTSTFQKAKERMEKLLSETSSAGSDESSHIGDLLDKHTGLPTDPDGTVTISEIAREELGDYLGEDQSAVVTLTREQFNQGVQIHNAEVRAVGHSSQIMEPVLGTAPCDEYGNRFSQQHTVHMITSDDSSSLSSPPETNYGGSEISFPSQTPRERVSSALPSTNYEESLLGLPLSTLPQDPFSTPRASAGLIACRYIQLEENTSQYAEQNEEERGVGETRKVHTPIPRKFEISDSISDDAMTEVEWREEEIYLTPMKKGKKRNKGKGVKRPVMPE